MTLEDLQAWAQTQIEHTAEPEIRPDIGVSVLGLVDELEQLQDYVRKLEAKLATLTQSAS
jgi:hypothetical protein